MSHTQLSQSSKDRVEGFQEEITKNHPNVSVVSVDYQPSKDDDPTEEESIEAVLEKYPDLKGYYATNQATSEAVLSVLDKYADRSVQMIGVDMGDTQKKAIEDKKSEVNARTRMVWDMQPLWQVRELHWVWRVTKKSIPVFNGSIRIRLVWKSTQDICIKR